tara:strand:+ start:12689 stop:13354 length:666 start_codon:yes stop_codon:yes gene_type:complete
LKLKDFLKIFGAIVALQVASVYRQESDVLYYLSKPLIMASLGIFVYSKLNGEELKAKGFLFVAIFFSWLGDILLMFEGTPMFLAGMGSFALAHVGYIVFHRIHFTKSNGYKIFSAVLYCLILATLVLYLVNIPKNLEMFIYAYFLVLMIHLIIATLNSDSSNLGALPAIGIGLFVVSDALIGINIFGGAKSVYISMAVMFSYSVSQAMIILGILKKKGLSE